MVRRLWKKDGFLAGSALLFFGNLIGQGAALAVSPWLSRLYSPGQFGEFSVFSGAVSCLAQLACLKYDMAVVTAEDEAEAGALFWLSFLAAPAVSLLSIAFFALWGGGLAGALLWAPAAGLLAGWFAALSGWGSRRGEWGALSRGNAAKGIGSALLQLALSRAPQGLAIGQSAAWGAGAACMVHGLPRFCGWRALCRAAGKYRGFPLFTLPGAFMGTAAYSVVPLWITSFYGGEAAGRYGLISRVLGAPLALISGAASQVFLSKAAGERAAGRSGRELYYRVSLSLAALSLPFFVGLGVWADRWIPWLLGEQWASSSGYLRALLPLFWVRLFTVSVSTAGIAAGRQRATMVWQGSLLLGAFAALGTAKLLGMGAEGSLLLLSGVLCLCYLAFYVYCGKNCV